MRLEAGKVRATERDCGGGWGRRGRDGSQPGPSAHKPVCSLTSIPPASASPSLILHALRCLASSPPPPTVSPISNPLIIFATHCPCPHRAAAAPWVCAHACELGTPVTTVPVSTGGQPGAPGRASLPGRPPSARSPRLGKGAQGEPSHSSRTHSPQNTFSPG